MKKTKQNPRRSNKNKKHTSKKRKSNKRQRIKKQTGGKRHVFSADLITSINEIKQMVIDSNIDHEICGSIAFNGENYDVYEHEAGSISGTTRANCLYEDYREPTIWHNHPQSSKYYPSLEDILKVIKLKNSTLWNSYIFTHFGYWELSTIRHIDVSEKLSSNIEKLLNWFYWKTQKGRVYDKDAIDRLINDLNNILLPNVMTIEFHLY
jgi:hypothetical protein